MEANLSGVVTVSLVYFAIFSALATGLLAVKNLFRTEAARELPDVQVMLCVFTVSALVTWLVLKPGLELGVPLLYCLLGAAYAQRAKNLTIAARIFWVGKVGVTVFGLLWGLGFIITMQVSTMTRTLMLLGVPFALFTLPAGLLQEYELLEVLCRHTWLRPRHALKNVARSGYPMVSLHVPAYAEPPEILIRTLDTLAQLRYPNFEVLVIDNNTSDATLWRPVEAHCRQLGTRFRFFHVDPLAGAKAGAVNFALRHTAPEAELIAVIDADYLARPTFLEDLVGHFDDPKTGFVQTPHDYRECLDKPYQRACYWEYKLFFLTTMVSLNERDAGLTVGTMCIIRRAALEAAGGWAEWCATEDSELSIRIHAAGYTSVYVPESYGQGLIPETFEEYKKQRFRWTYGPIQELKRHIGLFLPARWACRSALTVMQKIHHLNHGLGHLNIGLGVLFQPLGIAVAVSMLKHGETVTVPSALWVITAVSILPAFVLTWVMHRVLMQCSFLDMLGALIAKSALSHTVNVAALWGVFTRQIPWRRTNKFKALPMGVGRALYSTRVELSIGLALLFVGVVGIRVGHSSGVVFLLLLGVIAQSLPYFAASTMALLAERDLRADPGMDVAYGVN